MSSSLHIGIQQRMPAGRAPFTNSDATGRRHRSLFTIGLSTMPPTDNRFGIGCLTILFLVSGTWHIVISLGAFKQGTDVLYGRGPRVHVSPWFTLVLGVILLTVGLAGAYKTYKDKDKYPFYMMLPCPNKITGAKTGGPC